MAMWLSIMKSRNPDEISRYFARYIDRKETVLTSSTKTSEKSVKSSRKVSKAREMGVQVETLKEGDGCTFPKEGQCVTVHYTGVLASDGQKFDSSRDRGVPFKFHIGKQEVIKGWDEGIKQMSVGQRAKLTCSADYAYGKRGFPGVIPPNAQLVFDVELLHLH